MENKDLEQTENTEQVETNLDAVENDVVSVEELTGKTKQSRWPMVGKLMIVLCLCLTAFSVYLLGNTSGAINKKAKIVELNDKISVDMVITENGVLNENRSFTDVLISVSADSFADEIIEALNGAKVGETVSVVIQEILLKDELTYEDIPESAYQDGTVGEYYAEKDVKYSFTVNTLWKYSADVELVDAEATEPTPEEETTQAE